jgi:sugar lactone lactonase YvrE
MAAAFQLGLQEFGFVGSGLQRPECVLATRRGDLYASDARGGVAHILPDGSHRLIGCGQGPSGAALLPNGLALLRDGSLLVANLGELGGVWRLFPDGRHEPWLTEVAGERLPAVNFVWLDDRERVWMTVMFASHPGAGRHRFRADLGDGMILLATSADEPASARVVAKGLFTPNECRISADGRFLLVNETFSHRVARYALGPDGSLGSRDVLAQFDDDTYPDGISMDVEGGAWITSVASNRILRVLPDGSWKQFSHDVEPSHLAAVRDAVAAGTLNRELLYRNPARLLPNVTSIAFGGPDLRTAFVGSVSGTAIGRFAAPVAGVAPAHWDWS